VHPHRGRQQLAHQTGSALPGSRAPRLRAAAPQLCGNSLQPQPRQAGAPVLSAGRRSLLRLPAAPGKLPARAQELRRRSAASPAALPAGAPAARALRTALRVGLKRGWQGLRGSAEPTERGTRRPLQEQPGRSAAARGRPRPFNQPWVPSWMGAGSAAPAATARRGTRPGARRAARL